MPLARDQDDIIGFGMFDGKGNGIAPVANFMCAGRAGHDVRADERWIFAAWIIVGHDHDVGIGNRNRAHFRTLARVAVTTGAKDRDQLALCMRTQCRDCGAQAIGRVRIIDINGCAAFGNNGALQSATDGLQPREMRQQAFHVAATRHHDASGDKRVCGLIRTDQRQFHFVHVALNPQLKRLAQLRGFA